MATPDKMGSIICNRIDFNGVGALRGQRARTQQELTQVSPSVGGGGVQTTILIVLRQLGRTLKLTESWGRYKENDSKGEVGSQIGVACAAIA